MAHWGVALANGPHVNSAAVPPERARAASEALLLARRHAAHESEIERDPIEFALADAISCRCLP